MHKASSSSSSSLLRSNSDCTAGIATAASQTTRGARSLTAPPTGNALSYDNNNIRPLALLLVSLLAAACIDVAGGARAGDLIGWQGETHVSQENPDPTSKEGLNSIDPSKFNALKSQTLIMGSKRPKPSHHASTIAEVSEGVFMASWFGGAFEGKPDVGIYTARYEDGHWSAPELVVPPKVRRREGCVVKMPRLTCACKSRTTACGRRTMRAHTRAHTRTLPQPGVCVVRTCIHTTRGRYAVYTCA